MFREHNFERAKVRPQVTRDLRPRFTRAPAR